MTFTYSGKEVRQITKLFKYTNLEIAFRTHNTTENVLNLTSQIDEYKQRGIYLIKCLDCLLKYIKQAGRAFNTRYKKQLFAIRKSNGNSWHSNHIGHTYGTTADTVDITKEGKNLQ
jgi:hypothetical protein